METASKSPIDSQKYSEKTGQEKLKHVGKIIGKIALAVGVCLGAKGYYDMDFSKRHPEAAAKINAVIKGMQDMGVKEREALGKY